MGNCGPGLVVAGVVLVGFRIEVVETLVVLTLETGSEVDDKEDMKEDVDDKDVVEGLTSLVDDSEREVEEVTTREVEVCKVFEDGTKVVND